MNRPINSSRKSDLSCNKKITPKVQPSAMNGNSRSSSSRATALRAGSQLPNAATKSSSTNNGMIFASGMK
ncbi:hypothetical protein D3C76_1624460 [compost metagenome]